MKLTIERHQLSELAKNPAEYHSISRQLIALEQSCIYTLNADYWFQIRHDKAGDYFAFFRYLADGLPENVFTFLFRNRAREVVGCCQLIFQHRGDEVYAYFCDLKVQKVYRKRALKQLAWSVIWDTFARQNRSLLAHYCALQGGKQVDIKLYFVNMGGKAISENGLVRICQQATRLFQYLRVFLKQNVSLNVQIKRAYIAVENSDDLSDTVPAEKQIILLNQQHEIVQALDLHHALPNRVVVDNPNVDYRRTVVMGLSEQPTNQAFTLFLTRHHATEICDFLPHSGMI